MRPASSETSRTAFMFAAFPSSGGKLRGREAVDLRVRPGDRLLLARFADREAFGVDELHFAHAEEAEEVADVRRLGVVRLAGASYIAIYAAARGEHIDFLAGQEADRAVRGVAEGHAGARDVVEVGLEHRGQAEVVHRQAEHDDVGAPELRDE